MTTTKRRLVMTTVALAALSWAPAVTDAAPDAPVEVQDFPVRSTDVAVVALIAQASLESPTFRAMIETIRARNGIVYVHPGRCGHGVRSCLVNVVAAGERRILWAKVDVKKDERDLMGSIGHELRHAIEVLSDPTVRNDIAMFHFYRREASMGAGGAFETRAAILAGDAVRSEVGKYRRQRTP